MSCDCRPSTDLCDSCVELLGTGEEQERLRIIALLQKIAYCVLIEEDDNGDLQTIEQEELIALIRETA
jgi:hypothetical protein